MTPKEKRKSAHDRAIEIARQVATVAGYRANANRESADFRKAYLLIVSRIGWCSATPTSPLSFTSKV